jgi:hypothetical protein
MTFGQRVLGCLIKGPLGCLAFLFGAGVVFFLFLPAAGGRVLSRLVEERFAERHAGTLEMNEVWLPSLYGPQRVEGLSLRDPFGDEVLHADIVAPRLDAVGSGGAYGPIEIHAGRLDLVEDGRGSTNLARALALRDPARPPAAFRVLRGRRGLAFEAEELSFGIDRALTFALTVDRLSWTDAQGHELLLQGLVATGEVVAAAEGVRLELSGRARLGPGDEEDATFRWVVPHLERVGVPDAGSSESLLEVALTAPPLASLEALFAGVRVLEPALGDPVERVRLVVGADPGGTRLGLEVGSRGTELVAAGLFDPGERRLTGGAGEGARVEFPADSWWAHAALGELLPFADALELASADGRAALVLEDLAASLDGGWPAFSARVRVEGEWVSFALPPALAGELGGGRTRQTLPLTIPVEEGRVRFAAFPLATPRGAAELSGIYDLAARAYQPTILAFPPELGGRSFELAGPRAEPELAPLQD